MMRTIGITAMTAFLALAASQAAAQTVLWGEIDTDMPFEKVRSLYPDGKVYAGNPRLGAMITFSNYDIDGCKASVRIQMDREAAEPAARVQYVRLSGEKCDAKMYAQLIAKYGPPADVKHDTDRKKKKAVWATDGKTITFKAKTSGVDYWELTYSPVKDLGL